eukprot:346683_1
MASKQWFVPQINDLVSLGTVKKPKQGYILYIGPLIGDKYKGIYYGIELDRSDGKNNGSLDGNKYFKCKKNYGIFTKRNKIKKMIIKHKSFEYKMELLMSHFMHISNIKSHILPFDIYKMILFYIPPPKLYFTKDQRGIGWFKIHKNRLKVNTPIMDEKTKTNKTYSSKKKDEPKMVLLRFKDNSISHNDLGAIHQTLPNRQWKQSNFQTFELRLSLKCIGHFSSWVVPYDSDDGSESTKWPVFLILDAFKANEYKYKDKKVLLEVTFGDNSILKWNSKFDEQMLCLFGEKIDEGNNKWRYWVKTCGGVSKKIEPKNAIEVGFKFPYAKTTWVGINSNVQIKKQQWKFY